MPHSTTLFGDDLYSEDFEEFCKRKKIDFVPKSVVQQVMKGHDPYLPNVLFWRFASLIIPSFLQKKLVWNLDPHCAERIPETLYRKMKKISEKYRASFTLLSCPNSPWRILELKVGNEIYYLDVWREFDEDDQSGYPDPEDSWIGEE